MNKLLQVHKKKFEEDLPENGEQPDNTDIKASSFFHCP